MKNICRDSCGSHWTYITKEWIVDPWCHREKAAFSGQHGNISWRNIVIIDMFVCMICSNKSLEWVLFVFEFFISESKSQVYGIESSMMFFFFSNEELKDTGIVCGQYFPCILLAFHINSSHLQLCARVMLLHEDILSSWVTGDRKINDYNIIDNC